MLRSLHWGVSLAAIAGALMAALSAAPARAQGADYPNRPIRIVVPFSPGGAVDGPTRVIAQELGKRLKQQVIIDNKPGAGATIGSEMVAKAPADGYTLLLASQTNAISASLYAKLSLTRSMTSPQSPCLAASPACWSYIPRCQSKAWPN